MNMPATSIFSGPSLSKESTRRSDEQRPGGVLIAAHAWFDDLVGGAFRLASEFAEDLVREGADVHYLCCAPSRKAFQEHTVERGVQVWRYAPPGNASAWSRLQHHQRESRRLAERIASAHSIHWLNGHSPLQFAGARRAGALRDAKRIYSVHSPFDAELLAQSTSQSPSIKSRLSAWIARRIEAGNLNAADCVHTMSQFTRTMLATTHGAGVTRRTVVAPGWVDLQRTAPADRLAARGRLPEPWRTNDPIFFTLRRLEPRMGLLDLIAAASRLHQQGHRFQLLIAGGGSLQDSLAQAIRQCAIADHVHLLGRLPEVQLADAYAAADCFVLPTQALECFGLIVLEAFAAGVPVIASDAAAIPEIASVQGADWTFPAGEIATLTQRMRDFLTGRLKPVVDLRAVAAEFARERVTARWRRELLEAPTR